MESKHLRQNIDFALKDASALILLGQKKRSQSNRKAASGYEVVAAIPVASGSDGIWKRTIWRLALDGGFFVLLRKKLKAGSRRTLWRKSSKTVNYADPNNYKDYVK